MILLFSLEYFNILFYILLSLFLSFFLIFLGLILSSTITDFEKLSAYECGFIPLGDARQPFHVRFYLVGILFLLFDLEVIFLFPWVLYIHVFLYDIFILFFVLFFLILLIIGFLYENFKGALDWE